MSDTIVKPTAEQVRSAVLRVLGGIAPEADLKTLKPDQPFREQLDIDSMDFLNFVIGLHKELGVAVQEGDYGKLETVEGCVRFLGA